jgi:hypothetical protein
MKTVYDSDFFVIVERDIYLNVLISVIFTILINFEGVFQYSFKNIRLKSKRNCLFYSKKFLKLI